MAGWGAEKIFHLTSSGEALGSLGPETLQMKANTVKLQRYGGALPMCLVPSVVSLVDLFKGESCSLNHPYRLCGLYGLACRNCHPSLT
jgi:hypothetical protein